MERGWWTINALALEFGIDRRTVAKRLEQSGIEPRKEGSETLLAGSARML